MPAVAVSDFLLGLENAALAWLVLHRLAPAGLRRWFTAFFSASAVSALLGGVVHAFLVEGSLSYRLVWDATLLSIGASSFAAWMAMAYVLGGGTWIRVIRALSILLLVSYGFVVVALVDDYVLAAWASALSALALLLGFVVAWMRGARGARAGIGGLSAVLVATLLQRSQVQWGALDHNTIYHLGLMIAMALIFAGACGVCAVSSNHP